MWNLHELFCSICTPPTKSLWTVLPATDSTLTLKLFRQVAVRKPLYVNQPKGISCIVNGRKMITTGFTGTMYACLLNKPIELHHSTTYFAIFCISFQIFNNGNGDTRSCACYKVYGEDNFSNNSNSYNKESTCPKLTLHLPTVENMVAHILWWLAVIFMTKIVV